MSAGLLNTAIWALPQAALHLRACMRSRTAGEGAGPLAEQLDKASGSVPDQQLTEAAEAAMQVSCPACPWWLSCSWGLQAAAVHDGLLADLIAVASLSVGIEVFVDQCT